MKKRYFLPLQFPMSTVLDPNSEYVLSIRASNNVGPGPSIYATAKTQDEPPPEPAAALMPPIGLKAQVLSTTSVVLYWTDPTLKQSQVSEETVSRSCFNVMFLLDLVRARHAIL